MRSANVGVVALLLAACGGDVSSDPIGGSGGSGAIAGSGGAAGSGGSGGRAGGSTTCAPVAHGTLPSPGAKAYLKGPAVARTPNGFVVAWRAQHYDGELTVSVATLSPGGTLAITGSLTHSTCVDKEPADVSLSFDDQSGVLATQLPDCGSGAGAIFAAVGHDGEIGESVAPQNPQFSALLTHRQALAPSLASGAREFVYVAQSPIAHAERAVLDGITFNGVPIAQPFGSDPASAIAVATSPTTRAFLATSNGMSRFFVGNHDGYDLGSVAEYAYLPTSTATSIAAWDYRALAAVMDGGEIAWLAATPVTLIAQGKLPYAPLWTVNVVEDAGSIHFVCGTPGEIYVARSASAEELWLSGVPDVERRIDHTELPELGVFFSGEHIGAAAGHGLIAVAWLVDTDAFAGGWALLDCQ